MCEAVHFPHWFSCCCPQPSADTVKEVIQFSKDTLEKINKARMEGQYHEVSPGTSALLLHTRCLREEALSPSTFMIYGWNSCKAQPCLRHPRLTPFVVMTQGHSGDFQHLWLTWVSNPGLLGETHELQGRCNKLCLTKRTVGLGVEQDQQVLCVAHLLGAEDRCVVWVNHVPPWSPSYKGNRWESSRNSFFSPSFAHPGNI